MTTIERIESEKPVDGVPVPTRSKFELALYRMPNGSHFATLVDGSQETWEAYCDDLNRIAIAERAERKRFKPVNANDYAGEVAMFRREIQNRAEVA